MPGLCDRPSGVVSLSDLFAVEPVADEHADARVRLPHYVEPIEGEALLSWLIRVGRGLGLSPVELSRGAFGVDALAEPEWWRRPDDLTLRLIARRGGLSRERLEAMTLRGWERACDDEDADRFSAARRHERPSRVRGRPIAVCRQCLAHASQAHLQLSWMLGWTAVCERHGTVLESVCGVCKRPLRIGSLALNRCADFLICGRCGSSQRGGSGEAAHASTVALQAVLIAGKRKGRTLLPGLGPMDWQMTITFVDMVLAMVWSGQSDERCERLFARIADDIDMTDELWVTQPWRSNYGALLILAWVLSDLASRLRVMATS